MSGNETVRRLRILHVMKTFRVKPGEIQLVAQRGTVQVILFEPAESLAVRTIGDHVREITALCPAYQSTDTVKKFRRAGEIPGRGQNPNGPRPSSSASITGSLPSFSRRQLRLEIAAAVIEKPRKPLLAFRIAGERVTPIRLRAPPGHRIPVERAILVNQFRGNQPYAGAGAPRARAGAA